MAVDATTARRQNWKRLFNHYVNLNQQLDQAQPDKREKLEQAIADQEDELLDSPAPSFAAVIAKLGLLWDAELHGLDRESEAKRLILEDLGDLVAENRQLLGEAA